MNFEKNIDNYRVRNLGSYRPKFQQLSGQSFGSYRARISAVIGPGISAVIGQESRQLSGQSFSNCRPKFRQLSGQDLGSYRARNPGSYRAKVSAIVGPKFRQLSVFISETLLYNNVMEIINENYFNF